MFRLMKYEFRKMRTTLLIMLLILVATQIGFTVGIMAEKDGITAVSLLLVTILAAVVYAYVMISGIVSYSRELKDRTGYLIFMAPVRPISIVASKLLSTVLIAVAAVVLFGGCAVLDYRYMLKLAGFTRADWAELSISFRMMFAETGLTLTQVVLMGVYMVISMLFEIITTLCTAYLAMTLSATVMNNRKSFFRGLVSFGLFTVLTLAIGWVCSELLALAPDKVTDAEALMNLLGIAALFSAAVSVLFAFISAALLKRRVSL